MSDQPDTQFDPVPKFTPFPATGIPVADPKMAGKLMKMIKFVMKPRGKTRIVSTIRQRPRRRKAKFY